MSSPPSPRQQPIRSFSGKSGYRYTRTPSFNRPDGSVSASSNLQQEDHIQSPIRKLKNRKISNTSPASPRRDRSLVLHRQGLKPSTKPQDKRHLRPNLRINRHNKQWATVALSLLLVIIISTVFELKHRSTARQTASTSKQGETVQSAKHGVSEAEVGVAAYKDHRVANDYPRYLRIPKISVDARVIFSQTIKSDDMEPPANIHDISWYERSTKPGQEGVTMISGYAMGPTKRGVFNRLGSLKQNDQIELETGNGKKYVYKVVKLELYHKEEVDMEAMRMPAEEGVPALNILTFTERYDSRTQSSEKRMIVFTVLETILSE